MVAKKNQSALLAKYFAMYKKNPRSKVFAPLAESFRKLGMIDDAMKILREGIKNHPSYTLGYIVLANCYYDEQKYELTYNTLRPIAAQNTDNVSLQKIFAQSCIQLGHLEEALDTYKYLLFMNPRDKFFAEQVKRLEDDLQVGHKKISIDQLIKAPDMPAVTLETQDDDWVQRDFSQEPSSALQGSSKPLAYAEPSLDEWVMKKPGLEDHPILNNKVTERSLEDDFYADEFEEEGDIEEANAQALSVDAPIISHTLIDLYCAQQYYDKAVELLEKILELNPNDLPTKNKLSSVLKLRDQSDPNRPPVTEQEGHDELISIIESTVKTKSPKEIKLQKTFELFLDSLRKKSLQYR